MTIFVTNETDINMEFDYEEIANKVILASLDYESFPFEASVEVTLTDNEGIHQLNKEHRDIDRPTDVLSFPLIQYKELGDYDSIEDDEDNFDPDTGEAMLGDIVISLEKVIEQAENYGHSNLREYSFLICHSMLHLMGYDHMTDDEAKVMFKKQDEIMNQLGITR